MIGILQQRTKTRHIFQGIKRCIMQLQIDPLVSDKNINFKPDQMTARAKVLNTTLFFLNCYFLSNIIIFIHFSDNNACVYSNNILHFTIGSYHLAAVSCSLNAPWFLATGFGFWMTGKLGRAW